MEFERATETKMQEKKQEKGILQIIQIAKHIHDLNFFLPQTRKETVLVTSK